MAGSNEEGVDGIAVTAFQVISLEQAVGFRVPDHGLDGIAASQFSFNRGRGNSPSVADVDCCFAGEFRRRRLSCGDGQQRRPSRSWR